MVFSYKINSQLSTLVFQQFFYVKGMTTFDIPFNFRAKEKQVWFCMNILFSKMINFPLEMVTPFIVQIYIVLTCFALTDYQLDFTQVSIRKTFYFTLNRFCSNIVDMRCQQKMHFDFIFFSHFTSNTLTIPLEVRGFRMFVTENQRKDLFLRLFQKHLLNFL